MSITFINVVHCIIAVFLTVVVLVQPGKGGGFVMGGGTSQSLFGASGGGSFLTKVTSILAVLFVITSITITRMNSSDSGKSIFDDSKTAVQTEVVETPPAAAPEDSANGAAPGVQTSPSTETNSAPATKTE